MSTKKFTIGCPSCGVTQEVELHESINVQSNPELKQALLENRLNRVTCSDCEANFRIDMPLLYSDPEHELMVHWIPETKQVSCDQIIEDFDRSLEEINQILPKDITPPTVFLSNGTLSSTGIKKLFLWTIPSIFAFIR